MRVAPTVALTDELRQTLEQWARGRSLPARRTRSPSATPSVRRTRRICVRP